MTSLRIFTATTICLVALGLAGCGGGGTAASTTSASGGSGSANSGGAGSSGGSGASSGSGSSGGSGSSVTGSQYSVSVVVTGLNGSGLVLTDNGADSLSISAPGSTSFAKSLAAGAPYSVAVSSQPDGQVCTIAGGAGHIQGANVSVSVNCLSPDPNKHFLYVVSSNPAVVYSYVLNPSDGSITAGGTTTVANGARPFALRFSRDRRFAFLPTWDAPTGTPTGAFSVFSVDPSTGALTEVPNSPFGGNVGGRPVPDPTGRFVFTTGSASSGLLTFESFSLDSRTGALTLVPGASSVSFGSVGNIGDFVVDPTGRFAYIEDRTYSIIYGFAVNQSTGLLQQVPGSPVTGNGGLSFGGASLELGSDLTFEATGRFLYQSNYGYASISGFTVDQTTGALAAVSGSPFSLPAGGLLGPVSSVMPATLDPAGNHLFVAVGIGSQGAIVVLTIDHATGALASVGGSPFAVPNYQTNPWDPVRFDVSGKFAYFDAADVTEGFAIDSSTSALMALPAAVGPGKINVVTSGLVFSPVADFGYFASAPGAAPQLFGFAVNSATGAFAAVPNSPFTLPTGTWITIN